jgi:hypothetical protein
LKSYRQITTGTISVGNNLCEISLKEMEHKFFKWARKNKPL